MSVCGLDSAGRFSSCECKYGSLDAKATSFFLLMYAVKSGKYVRPCTKVAKQDKVEVLRCRGVSGPEVIVHRYLKGSSFDVCICETLLWKCRNQTVFFCSWKTSRLLPIIVMVYFAAKCWDGWHSYHSTALDDCFVVLGRANVIKTVF